MKGLGITSGNPRRGIGSPHPSPPPPVEGRPGSVLGQRSAGISLCSRGQAKATEPSAGLKTPGNGPRRGPGTGGVEGPESAPYRGLNGLRGALRGRAERGGLRPVRGPPASGRDSHRCELWVRGRRARTVSGNSPRSGRIRRIVRPGTGAGAEGRVAALRSGRRLRRSTCARPSGPGP